MSNPFEMEADESPAPARGRPDPRSLVLDREQALLLLIDVQERPLAAVEPGRRQPFVEALRSLLLAAGRLGLPVVASEQEPERLGATLSELRGLVPVEPLPKLDYSVGANQLLARAVARTGRRQILLGGLEAHGAVFQTARDLALGGFFPFVVADAVLSRRPDDEARGLALCQQAGATVTCLRAAVLDLLGRAGTPEQEELATMVE